MSAIHIPPTWRLPEREVTPEDVYLDRRRVLRALGLGALALGVPSWACAREVEAPPTPPPGMTDAALGDRYADRFPAPRNESIGLGRDRSITPEAISAGYNNFYEFTTTKDRVWELAKDYALETPWKIEVTGLVERPRTLDLDDLFAYPLEERHYRFRCVERWSSQMPWTGFPLQRLIDDLAPLSSARYVRFVTVLDRKGMPGVAAARHYPWPYYEALRLDEARHPLAFVALGSYGHALPMQHGAPWRIVMPWKYGYKSPKSLVAIEFTKKRPKTFWNELQPAEYGFISNVDPRKPHPRWSQRWETDIGTQKTRETRLYNGYAEEVSALYHGNEV